MGVEISISAIEYQLFGERALSRFCVDDLFDWRNYSIIVSCYTHLFLS